MEPDGSVYACDHLIDAKYRLGCFDQDSKFADYVDAAIEMDFGTTRACDANARVAV